MIIGIGTDIVDVVRIQRLLDEQGDRFKNRVFTKNEQAKAENSARPAHSYAKRFAAKEAFIKAIQNDGEGISWTEIEIINASSGAPSLHLTGSALSALQTRHPHIKTFVSLTDTDTLAQAMVILSVET